MNILHEHNQMSNLAKKTKIMETLTNSLKYQNNPKTFHAEVMSIISKIRKAECTVEDFILHSILSAFPSKHKIRIEIIKDINAGNIRPENMYDKVRYFCSLLESLKGTDGKQSANLIEVVCHRCGKKGHKTPQCYAKYHKNGKKLEDSKSKGGDSEGKGKGRKASASSWCETDASRVVITDYRRK